MIKQILKYITTVVLSIMLLTACGTSGCYENRSSIPRAGFYAYNKPEQAIAIDSISIYGIGMPNNITILEVGRSVSTTVLPFRNDADTTQFVIHYDMKQLSSPQYNDTLTISYERYPYFISGDCGVVFNYIIKSFDYTQNMIDSVAIVAPEVTNVDTETIQIFYYANV